MTWKFDPDMAVCPWLIERPNNNPEPSCVEDTYDIVECAAPLVLVNEFGSWKGLRCGHHYVAMEDPERWSYDAETMALDREEVNA